MRAERWILGLWLLLLLAGIAIAARTAYRTDMGDFLPRSHAPAAQALAAEVNGGAGAHLLLVDLAGPPPSVLARLSTELAARLRADQQFFGEVLNGDPASLAAVQEFVWRHRYLLSPETNAQEFSVAGLHAALIADLGLLGADFGSGLARSLPADPTGAAMSLLRVLAPDQGPALSDGVWMGAAQKSALLIVQTKNPAFDLDAEQKSVASLAQEFVAARQAVPGAAGAKMRVTGPGIFALHARDVTKRDVTRLSLLAALGAIALLAFAYRSARALLLGLLPIISGAIAAIAAVSLGFGFVHGITLGFGVTLIGESMDYAIYLLTQRAPEETPRAAMARLWPVLRLGAFASIAGFASMLFSSFTGFAQLGLFSIAGLAAAALTTRFVLPVLIPRGFVAPGAPGFARPLDWLLRHGAGARLVILAAALAASLVLILHRGPLWDDDLMNLSPIPAADEALDQQMRHALGLTGPRYFLVLPAAGAQAALAASEAASAELDQARAAGLLAAYQAPSAILPSLRTQQARRAALPDDATLRARFAAASAGLPFRRDIFAPFFAGVAQARATPLLTAADLPPPLALQLQSTLLRTQTGWMAMIPLHGVTDPVALAALIRGQNPGGVLVDLNAASAGLLRKFETEAVALAVCGTLAVFLVLLAGLRSLRRVALVLAPLLLALLVTAALLTLGGQKLTIFKVAGFLLIVAVGSNYALFFERTAWGAPGWPRAAASILLANLCTVAAYGLMALAAIPVLHDIGETVAIGAFLALLFSAVLTTRRAR